MKLGVRAQNIEEKESKNGKLSAHFRGVHAGKLYFFHIWDEIKAHDFLKSVKEGDFVEATGDTVNRNGFLNFTAYEVRPLKASKTLKKGGFITGIVESVHPKGSMYCVNILSRATGKAIVTHKGRKQLKKTLKGKSKTIFGLLFTRAELDEKRIEPGDRVKVQMRIFDSLSWDDTTESIKEGQFSEFAKFSLVELGEKRKKARKPILKLKAVTELAVGSLWDDKSERWCNEDTDTASDEGRDDILAEKNDTVKSFDEFIGENFISTSAQISYDATDKKDQISFAISKLSTLYMKAKTDKEMAEIEKKIANLEKQLTPNATKGDKGRMAEIEEAMSKRKAA